MADPYTLCPVCNRRIPARAKIPPHHVTPFREAPWCTAAGLTRNQAEKARELRCERGTAPKGDR